MVTKQMMKKFLSEMEEYDFNMDTFVFTNDGNNKINARSKFEGVNATVLKDDPDWKENLRNHINWQIGYKL